MKKVILDTRKIQASVTEVTPESVNQIAVRLISVKLQRFLANLEAEMEDFYREQGFGGVSVFFTQQGE